MQSSASRDQAQRPSGSRVCGTAAYFPRRLLPARHDPRAAWQNAFRAYEPAGTNAAFVIMYELRGVGCLLVAGGAMDVAASLGITAILGFSAHNQGFCDPRIPS